MLKERERSEGREGEEGEGGGCFRPARWPALRSRAEKKRRPNLSEVILVVLDDQGEFAGA